VMSSLPEAASREEGYPILFLIQIQTRVSSGVTYVIETWCHRALPFTSSFILARGL
jgi:hypothetical protein